MAFKTLKEIADYACMERIPFWNAVLDDDCSESGMSHESAIKKMEHVWTAMLDAVQNYNPDEVSASGLSGTDGERFSLYASRHETLCGSAVAEMIEIAIKTAEANACMHRIVACPTAGSCGVVPSVLIPPFRRGTITETDCIHALFTAAGIGKIIAMNASISGAECGCQAEIGTASAMASGALAELKGGSPSQIVTAAGFALQNLLGLVCDPVGGLVEIPCIKRNVIGCVNAASCADMALAGICAKIPADETVCAMAAVGHAMSSDLRETGQGGLAATPSVRILMHCQ
ncbi:MAG: L-serine ammonia-lyase, iron-sulfur-dependent, subunit alpha [Treponema sp.]|nr:L-serine ammonia-lyase, iron-sulfur-dependent, subunit alpha [Treponema sp.]